MLDLHMHSIYSDDADFDPEYLVQQGLSANLKYMSLTDHNSVRGVSEMKAAGKRHKIKIISGIEIDCTFAETNLHLLGYGIDESSSDFVELENNFTKLAFNAVEPKIEKLRELDFIITEDELYRLAGDRVPQEEQMAELILNTPQNNNNPLLLPYRSGGSRSDMPLINFFWDFFGTNKPAYVPIEYISLKTAIDLVKSNGGVPILAHPGANLKNKLELLAPIMDTGIDGLELYSSYHTPELASYFRKFAIEHNLLISCGSDFHGKNKPLINLGGTKYLSEDQAWIFELLTKILN